MAANKKIENPKTELSKKSSITDYDMIHMARATEKMLCSSYLQAMESVSHEQLFSLYTDMLKESYQQQRKLFDLQFQHGWCSFTQVDEQELKSMKEQFANEKKSLK
ncbi:spore coat protein [Sporosarcina soli]|uniref:Spore coat protein n=1 Tax=Sporosarcina soli TaxID=334736 RepID=A0ABW0TLB8_9BACL